MAVTLSKGNPSRFIGASTDTKPTNASNSISPGTTFYEYNTGIMYITYDGTNWVEKDTITRLEAGTAVVGKVRPVNEQGEDFSTFGEPELRYALNSRAYWSRGTASPRNQKGGTGWLACLHGRVQTGDDWAAVYIPVNEMLVTNFDTAKWSYYMTTTQTMGVNIVIWVHDPDDFDKRAEITQLGGVAGLEKAAGWNAHEFDSTDAGMFWYGENTGTHDTTVTAGTQYTWAQFQADDVFSAYTIYRVSIEFGWEAAGTFDHAWVAEVMLNGTNIPLKPRSDADLAPIHDYLDIADTAAFTVAPKTPFQLLSLDVHASAVLDTGEVLTITKDAGMGGSFDAVILSEDLFVGNRISYHAAFGEGYEFHEDDELDVAQANGSDDTIGFDLCWKPI